MIPEFKHPWRAIDAAAAARAQGELRAEAGPGHPLHGVPVRAIAENVASDDVLFVLPGENPACAVVHLTWSRTPQRLPWPDTQSFASLEDWVRDGMIPNFEDFHS